jgi:RimJ/RimL family protein N-acetyltransferase
MRALAMSQKCQIRTSRPRRSLFGYRPVAEPSENWEGTRMFPDVLHTPRLMLRPIALEDAEPIFDTYGQDPEVTRFVVWRPHQKIEDAEAFVSQCISRSPEASRTYALCDREGRTLRGVLGLTQIKPHHVEFGYALARRWWGQGLMTEALIMAVDWAFAQPGNFRVSGVCDVENIASARVMEKAGLVREGRLRRWIVHPNISEYPRDCFSYAKAR